MNILLINMHAFQLSTKFFFLPLLIKKPHIMSPIMSPLRFPLTWLFVAKELIFWSLPLSFFVFSASVFSGAIQQQPRPG